MDEEKRKIKSEFELHYNVTMSNFEEYAKKLSHEDKLDLLFRLRGLREFYKKILNEDFRKDHPNSLRYVDANEKLAIVQKQGKFLSGLIKE